MVKYLNVLFTQIQISRVLDFVSFSHDHTFNMSNFGR